MRRKAVQKANALDIANPKRNKTRRRVLKTVRSLLKILNKRFENVQVKPRPRGRPPKVKVQAPTENQEEEGVTCKQIENWYKRKWPDSRGETPDLQAAINEEVESGRLILLPNKKLILKNWTVGVKSDAKPSVPDAPGQEGTVPADGGLEAGGELEEARDPVRLSSSCASLAEQNNLTSSDLIADEESKTAYKRKSLPAVLHMSLLKKFKVENGDDVRLVTSESCVKLENVCETCDKTAQCNNAGQPEPFLTCKECNVSFHPSCLAYAKELAEKAMKFPWECASCKTCVVCGDAEEEQMLICDSCDRGYHMRCHDPPVVDKLSPDDWLCSPCMNDSEKMLTEAEPSGECSSNVEGNTSSDVVANGNPKVKTSTGHKSQAETSNKQGNNAVSSLLLPTPSSSPSRTAEAEEENRNVSSIDFPLLPKLVLSVPGDPPNATNWTVEDVHGYFIKAGFSQQAETFKNEEIDGKALLLLTRPDVLSGMKFKLGPALKMYAHVQRIQESSFSP